MRRNRYEHRGRCFVRRIEQPDLFAHVLTAYAKQADGTLTNDELYRRVADSAGLTQEQMRASAPIGVNGKRHGVLTRQIRWHQQTLKRMGVLSHVPGVKSIWQFTHRTDSGLHQAGAHTRLVAFSTRLGVAIWARCESVLTRLDEPVALLCTSPPYPLSKPRDYGNPTEGEFTDFICHAIEPIVRHLLPGGSICLNLGNDIFVPGSPARSLYRERLTLALCERFSLHKMDDLIWFNPCRPPGPVEWASKRRVQLNGSYETVTWLTNDPMRVRADNRRVLQPHTERQQRLIDAGGEARNVRYADGAHGVRVSSFANKTQGRIPRNVLEHTHGCSDTRQYRRDAAALGLPIHGAMQPLSIPEFLIKLLTQPGDLVVDPFGGTVKTGRAAENTGRRWLVIETMLDYLRASAQRFVGADGFQMHEAIAAWPKAA